MTEIKPDIWSGLQRYTAARIGLGHSGISLPSRVNLRFQLDHARARDAVLEPADWPALQEALMVLGITTEIVASAATDRRTYLQRPDLGRTLPADDWQRLREWADQQPRPGDIAIVVGDGLSSRAVMQHAAPLLRLLVPRLREHYALAPVVLASQARVALADDIGEAMGACLTLVLIGERPGLSSPDSLGIYLTWKPRRGRLDSERNCISNIRPEGLQYAAAADTCRYLVNAAFQREISGVRLKDQSLILEQDAGLAIPFLRPSR